ncbi:MAG: hypothetical protein MJZ74_06035 [Muribaculaceae bacterium]|nr:hypothetical protein [Muribaculaceae bacterium]
MKRLFLLFALMGALCVQSLNAQVIKGDMNDDGVFDIDDVNSSVNTVIGKRTIQYVREAATHIWLTTTVLRALGT